MSQHQQELEKTYLESNGVQNKATGFQQRLYDSPSAVNALNESANGSLTYGGCFNNYSPWNMNSSRYAGSSPFPTQKRGGRNYAQDYSQTPRYSNYRGTPRRNGSTYDPVRLRLVDLEETSFASSTAVSNASNSFSNYSRLSAKCTLPAWAIDNERNVAPSVTLHEVMSKDSLFEFATDKNGCRFLQEQYPVESDGGIHDEIFTKMVEKRETFLSMCRNMFGNFFIQRLIECSNVDEQEIVMEHLVTDMYSLCLDKSACRVIQLAIQKLDIHLASRLSQELRDTDLIRLSIDQNGNHVIQKIIKTLPVSAWDFIVDFFKVDYNLIAVCEDKYGCRVIQSTIEKLSESSKSNCYEQRINLLQSLMEGITRNCAQLASNEFANYVIQHVIKSGGVMEEYRDVVIEKYLLRNLLSMSQEKYASHVVEVAYLFAPQRLLLEMMEEIFEGYIPHPDTNRDALDILLFHQYGNYIVQQMINICCSAILGQQERSVDETELELYSGWLERIKERVVRNNSRLERFSSGKKIIEALDKAVLPECR